MRKWLCIGVSLLFLLTAGCTLLPNGEESSAPATTTSTTTTTTTTTATTTTTTTAATTTTTAAQFITEAQAVAIVEQYWNIRTGDRDPKTGFMMTVSPMELPTADHPEYRIALRWLVEVDGQVSHPSMLDSIRINAYTGDIVDPTTLQPE